MNRYPQHAVMCACGWKGKRVLCNVGLPCQGCGRRTVRRVGQAKVRPAA